MGGDLVSSSGRLAELVLALGDVGAVRKQENRIKTPTPVGGQTGRTTRTRREIFRDLRLLVKGGWDSK